MPTCSQCSSFLAVFNIHFWLRLARLKLTIGSWSFARLWHVSLLRLQSLDVGWFSGQHRGLPVPESIWMLHCCRQFENCVELEGLHCGDAPAAALMQWTVRWGGLRQQCRHYMAFAKTRKRIRNGVLSVYFKIGLKRQVLKFPNL